VAPKRRPVGAERRCPEFSFIFSTSIHKFPRNRFFPLALQGIPNRWFDVSLEHFIYNFRLPVSNCISKFLKLAYCLEWPFSPGQICLKRFN